MESTRSFPPDLSVMFIAEREDWRPLIYVGGISYLFGQGNCIFIRKKSGNSHGILERDVYSNHVVIQEN